MAKRFTDSEKYKDPWFRKLNPTCKSLFLFMCDDCNHAGIWKDNLDTFNFLYQTAATGEDIKRLGDKVIHIGPETYLIQSFIKFQYGMLNPSNKAHLGVIKALAYAGVDYSPYLAPSKELASPQGIGIGEGAGIGIGTGVGTVELTHKDIPF